MNINKAQIIKYYEYQLNASRTNEPVTYHFLMRQMESVHSCFSCDELDYINCLIKDSGIDPAKKDAIAITIIDKLTKDTHYMNTIFETKDQYIAFRTKWKEIHNELRYKKETRYKSSHYRNGKWEDFEVQQSALSLPFHLIFLAATGKLEKGVSKIYIASRNEAKWASYTAAFGYFGDTLNAEQRHLIVQNIHEYMDNYRHNY